MCRGQAGVPLAPLCTYLEQAPLGPGLVRELPSVVQAVDQPNLWAKLQVELAHCPLWAPHGVGPVPSLLEWVVGLVSAGCGRGWV